MRRSLRLGLCGLLAACGPVLAGAAEAQTVGKPEDRLYRDLAAKPEFRRLVKPWMDLTGLAFAGGVVPGDLVYGASPEPDAIVLKGLTTDQAVNCDKSEVRISSGTLTGSYTDSSSFTTTRGWSVGTSVSFETDWPIVGSTWTFSASYNGSNAKMTGEQETWSVSRDYNMPMLPRTVAEVQMQVIQQKIDGRPYSLDLELTGKANVTYKPRAVWVNSSGSIPADAVVGGNEVSPTSGVSRNLVICRARYAGAWHPGKVVARRCNISYGGKEFERRSFQVLTGPPRLFDWEEHSGGDTNADLGIVAGEENRNDKHGGKLYVCRAEHRGGTHPGKLVINDCMFGYGGKEIERGNYEILTFSKDSTGKIPVQLETYLSKAERTFTIEGRFDGVLATSGRTVYSDSRPVTERECPSGALVVAAPQTPPRTGGFAVRALGANPAVAAVDKAEPSQAVLRDARPLNETRLPAAAPEAKGEPTSVFVSRMLRLERPHLFGPDVLAVQLALIEAGWPIRADGFHGPQTDRALRHFQRANGLQVDGIFGPRTQARLGL